MDILLLCNTGLNCFFLSLLRNNVMNYTNFIRLHLNYNFKFLSDYARSSRRFEQKSDWNLISGGIIENVAL